MYTRDFHFENHLCTQFYNSVHLLLLSYILKGYNWTLGLDFINNSLERLVNMYKCVTNSGEFHKTKNPYIYVCVCVCVCIIHTFSLCMCGLQLTRLLCPWNSPGNNTGVGSHPFLQGIFPTQGLNLDLPHCRQICYHLSHQGYCMISSCLWSTYLISASPKVSDQYT